MIFYDIEDQYYELSNLSFCSGVIEEVSYLIDLLIIETNENKIVQKISENEITDITNFYKKFEEVELKIEDKILDLKVKNCSFNNYYCSKIEDDFRYLGQVEGYEILEIIIRNYDEKILNNEEINQKDEMIFRCFDFAGVDYE